MNSDAEAADTAVRGSKDSYGVGWGEGGMVLLHRGCVRSADRTDDNSRSQHLLGCVEKRLLEEGADELLTKCKRLKMRAADGKMRLTDVADNRER